MKNKKAFQLIINIAIFIFLYTANVHCQDGNIADETGNNEYMSIVTRQFDCLTSRIHISKPNGEYEEINIDILKKKNRFDFSTIHEIIEKLSKEGWEVVSSNMVFAGGRTGDEEFYTYYLLKRKKEF